MNSLSRIRSSAHRLRWTYIATPSAHATGGQTSQPFSTDGKLVKKDEEKPLPPGATPDMEENVIQGLRNVQDLKAASRVTIAPWMTSVGETDEMDAEGAYLPENVEETAVLDRAHDMSMQDIGGFGEGGRYVFITQREKAPSQSPTHREKSWVIEWQDDLVADNWDNTLMGWVSGADPMQNIALQLEFDTKEQAIYFAKKRGWQYEVAPELIRKYEDGKVEYQDNFLPKIVAKKVQRDKSKCNWFERSAAGASHYFRPLKYHGDGVVPQYGPNGDAAVAPDVEGKYKLR